ncbi:MAG: sigma factor-like helix-turn-helix DNA-binding protein [Bacteroidota bacterium]
MKEISQIADCSEGTVKSRLFYALKKLAQNMQVFDPKRG